MVIIFPNHLFQRNSPINRAYTRCGSVMSIPPTDDSLGG
jgi:hypothetical protein